MRCISPLTIRKAGVSSVVPCGKCNFCLQTKRFDWSFRLYQELKVSKSAHFLTLTLSDENPHFDNNLDKRTLQLFFKKLRKANDGNRKSSVRYYAVGEYGTKTGRAHYHAIVFNLRESVANDMASLWSLGHVQVGTVTPASIHYVTKYVINRDMEVHGRQRPFCTNVTPSWIGFKLFSDPSLVAQRRHAYILECWRYLVKVTAFLQGSLLYEDGASDFVRAEPLAGGRSISPGVREALRFSS